jgi:hypothetical protein
VASPDAPITFVATERGKITMFIQTIGNAHAGRKVARRKYLPPFFVALVFAFALYPSKAEAQIVGDIEVNVPFQFQAGNAKLPAGEYRIHMLDDSNLTVMQISSADGSTSTVFQVEDTEATSAATKSEVIFNRYGDQYFLAKLFEEGSAIGSEVIESRTEKTISEQTTQAQEHVPAHRGEQGK